MSCFIIRIATGFFADIGTQNFHDLTMHIPVLLGQSFQSQYGTNPHGDIGSGCRSRICDHLFVRPQTCRGCIDAICDQPVFGRAGCAFVDSRAQQGKPQRRRRNQGTQ